VKSHSSILKKRIITINIHNFFSFKRFNGDPSYLRLTVFGNTTIWEIKQLIGKKLKIIQAKIFMNNFIHRKNL